jgi:hypothetical protein
MCPKIQKWYLYDTNGTYVVVFFVIFSITDVTPTHTLVGRSTGFFFLFLLWVFYLVSWLQKIFFIFNFMFSSCFFF